MIGHAAFANHAMSKVLAFYITNAGGFKDEVDGRLKDERLHIVIDGEQISEFEEIEIKLGMMLPQLSKITAEEWYGDDE